MLEVEEWGSSFKFLLNHAVAVSPDMEKVRDVLKTLGLTPDTHANSTRWISERFHLVHEFSGSDREPLTWSVYPHYALREMMQCPDLRGPLAHFTGVSGIAIKDGGVIVEGVDASRGFSLSESVVVGPNGSWEHHISTGQLIPRQLTVAA